MDLMKFLPRVFLFNTLSETEIETIASVSSIKKLSKNEKLFSDGRKAMAFFIVIDGSFKVFKLASDGSEQTIHIFTPFNLIAEAAIFDIEVYPADCKALKGGSVIRIPKTEFIQILTSNPEISLKMTASYSKRLRFFVKTIESLYLKDIEQRLVKYLIEHSVSIKGEMIYHQTITKKELASLFGTTQETLSRTLKNLKDDGLILETDKKIKIIDKDNLKSLISLT